MISFICGIYNKNYTNELNLQSRNRLTDIRSKLMVTKWEEGRRIHWKLRIIAQGTMFNILYPIMENSW